MTSKRTEPPPDSFYGPPTTDPPEPTSPPPPPKQEPAPPPDRSLDGLTGGACRNCIGTAVALYDLRREHARLKNVLQGDHGLTPKELARAWVAADRDAKLKRIKKECTWLQALITDRNATISRLKKKRDETSDPEMDQALRDLAGAARALRSYVATGHLKMMLLFVLGVLLGYWLG